VFDIKTSHCLSFSSIIYLQNIKSLILKPFLLATGETAEVPRADRSRLLLDAEEKRFQLHSRCDALVGKGGQDFSASAHRGL
jgi:hypothetical protein